jgi:hypothetical protein
LGNSPKNRKNLVVGNQRFAERVCRVPTVLEIRKIGASLARLPAPGNHANEEKVLRLERLVNIYDRAKVTGFIPSNGKRNARDFILLIF